MANSFERARRQRIVNNPIKPPMLVPADLPVDAPEVTQSQNGLLLVTEHTGVRSLSLRQRFAIGRETVGVYTGMAVRGVWDRLTAATAYAAAYVQERVTASYRRAVALFAPRGPQFAAGVAGAVLALGLPFLATWSGTALPILAVGVTVGALIYTGDLGGQAAYAAYQTPGRRGDILGRLAITGVVGAVAFAAAATLGQIALSALVTAGVTRLVLDDTTWQPYGSRTAAIPMTCGEQATP